MFGTDKRFRQVFEGKFGHQHRTPNPHLLYLQRIKEVPDFTDDIVAELLESTIHLLSKHMKEWMKSISEYEGESFLVVRHQDHTFQPVSDLNWPDVRRLLDELSAEIQLDVECLSRSIASFVSVGACCHIKDPPRSPNDVRQRHSND